MKNDRIEITHEHDDLNQYEVYQARGKEGHIIFEVRICDKIGFIKDVSIEDLVRVIKHVIGQSILRLVKGGDKKC